MTHRKLTHNMHDVMAHHNARWSKIIRANSDARKVGGTKPWIHANKRREQLIERLTVGWEDVPGTHGAAQVRHWRY